VLFNIGSIEVHSYTVCMLTAFVVVGWFAYREAKRRHRLTEDTLMVGSIGLVGALVGAKLGMLVFLGPAEFWRLLPTIPSHGSTLFGGLTGGYIAMVIAERALHVDRCTGDLVAPFLPLGQAIGRLGNFLAGDAYGIPSTLPWSVNQAGTFRHPVQLYELVLNLALFAFLFRRRLTSFRDGELFQMYIVGYSLIRFPLEFLRYQPTPLYFLGLTLVQWLCIGAVLVFGYQLYLQHKASRYASDLLSHLSEEKRTASPDS
jgi:phosphatidylglycerol:prolipoprotein diacylglycerol transferase